MAHVTLGFRLRVSSDMMGPLLGRNSKDCNALESDWGRLFIETTVGREEHGTHR